MNALAGSETVKGDFSGPSISYLGGKATFQMEGDEYRMRFERDSVVRGKACRIAKISIVAFMNEKPP